MGSSPEIESFNLSDRVDKTIKYLEKRMPSFGGKVELINKINNDLKINANGTLVAWAIENLIRNGIDSIKSDNGQITLNMHDSSKSIKILVADNGCGIPKKDWKNIFRPGFSTKKSGWGLGLSLCQRIVNDVHSGKICVLESKLNVGTTFEITIPKT